MELAALRWAGWLRRAQAMTVRAATVFFDAQRPKLELALAMFMHLDCAKEGTASPGFGGFMAGFAFHIPLSESARTLPIAILEAVTVWLGLQLYAFLFAKGDPILLLTDATSAVAALKGNTNSRALTRVSVRVRALRVFSEIRKYLWFAQVWGEGHLLADYSSRGYYQAAREVAALLGFEIQWISVPKALLVSLEAFVEVLVDDVKADGKLKVQDEGTSFASLDKSEGICTFESAAEIGLCDSTLEALNLWRKILLHCGTHPNEPWAVHALPYLTALKEGALDLARRFRDEKGSTRLFPGVPARWAEAVLSVDAELSEAAWLMVVSFGCEQPFGSPLSLHLMADFVGVRIGIFVTDTMDMFHVGSVEGKLLGVVQFERQHASAVAKLSQSLEEKALRSYHISSGKVRREEVTRLTAFGIQSLAKKQSRKGKWSGYLQSISSCAGAGAEEAKRVKIPAQPASELRRDELHNLVPLSIVEVARRRREQLTSEKNLVEASLPLAPTQIGNRSHRSRFTLTEESHPILGRLLRARQDAAANARGPYALNGEAHIVSSIIGASYRAAGPKLVAALNSHAWREWEVFTQLAGTEAIRDDDEANSGRDPVGVVNERDLCHAFAEWRQGRMAPARGNPEALPQSAWNDVDTIRRVFKLLGLRRVDLPNRSEHLLEMEKEWLRRNPRSNLLKKRKEPIPTDLAQDILRTRDGTDFGYGPVHRSNILWRSYFAACALSDQTGSRRDEVSTHEGLDFDPIKTSWSHVSWMIHGVVRENPTHVELNQMSTGCFVLIRPGGSKADPTGSYWGQHLAYLPYCSSSPSNAAREITELAKLYPSGSMSSRARWPLFSSDLQGTPLWYNWLGDVLVTHINFLRPGTGRKYSWHSWRIRLACALLAANAPPETIQALCRWKSPKSLHAYARINPDDYGSWLMTAQHSIVSSVLASSIPTIDSNKDRNHLQQVRPIGRQFDARRAPGFRNGSSPAGIAVVNRPVPPVATPQRPSKKRSRTQLSLAVGKIVRVPASEWPDIVCTENSGQGYSGKITRVATLVRSEIEIVLDQWPNQTFIYCLADVESWIR